MAFRAFGRLVFNLRRKFVQIPQTTVMEPLRYACRAVPLRSFCARVTALRQLRCDARAAAAFGHDRSTPPGTSPSRPCRTYDEGHPGTTPVDLNLEQVISAARVRKAPMASETAGYLALAVADALAVSPGVVRDTDVMLNTEGTVWVAGAQRIDDPVAPERSVRALLQRLLAAAAGSSPALTACARRANGPGLRSLIEELETALIPVNRDAARRAIARLAREAVRQAEIGPAVVGTYHSDRPPAPRPSPAKAPPVRPRPEVAPSSAPPSKPLTPQNRDRVQAPPVPEPPGAALTPSFAAFVVANEHDFTDPMLVPPTFDPETIHLSSNGAIPGVVAPIVPSEGRANCRGGNQGDELPVSSSALRSLSASPDQHGHDPERVARYAALELTPPLSTYDPFCPVEIRPDSGSAPKTTASALEPEPAHAKPPPSPTPPLVVPVDRVVTGSVATGDQAVSRLDARSTSAPDPQPHRSGMEPSESREAQDKAREAGSAQTAEVASRLQSGEQAEPAATTSGDSPSTGSCDRLAPETPREQHREPGTDDRTVQPKRVDELLASFAVSEKRSSRNVSGELKKLVGLEPTPLVPLSAWSPETLSEPVAAPKDGQGDAIVLRGPTEFQRPRAPKTALSISILFLVALVSAAVGIYLRWPTFFLGR